MNFLVSLLIFISPHKNSFPHRLWILPADLIPVDKNKGFSKTGSAPTNAHTRTEPTSKTLPTGHTRHDKY